MITASVPKKHLVNDMSGVSPGRDVTISPGGLKDQPFQAAPFSANPAGEMSRPNLDPTHLKFTAWKPHQHQHWNALFTVRLLKFDLGSSINLPFLVGKRSTGLLFGPLQHQTWHLGRFPTWWWIEENQFVWWRGGCPKVLGFFDSPPWFCHGFYRCQHHQLDSCHHQGTCSNNNRFAQDLGVTTG